MGLKRLRYYGFQICRSVFGGLNEFPLKILHLDGAWSFARHLLTEDYQSGLLDRTAGFIEGIHHFAFNDMTVMNIVYEEAEGYFRGQKDMESVVGVTQNRVGLYLQEQMK